MSETRKRSRGSIDDVAREAGVSRSTASRVLRGLRKVLPETRDKIFAAAEKYSYRPNVVARVLRTGERRAAALILDSEAIVSPFYGKAITTLKKVLAGSGLRLIISVVSDDEEASASLEELAGWCCAAAVLDCTGAAGRSEADSSLPVVLLNAPALDDSAKSALPWIAFDEADGMRQAVEHLASLGHRNIAYFGGRSEQWKYRRREQGFLSGMKDSLLSVRPEWTFRVDPRGSDMIVAVAEAFELAVSSARCRLTGIVCAEDAIALEVLAAVRRAGKQSPEDFSVIGYGDSLEGRLSLPKLTTIAHDGAEYGEALGRMLLQAASGGELEARGQMLAARLLVSESTAARTGRLAPPLIPSASAVSESAEQDGSLPDGVYEFEARHSGMMLDVPNFARTPGCHVWQWQRNGTPAQLWLVTSAGSSWKRVRNIGNWLYLDADAALPDVCPVVTNPLNEQNPDIQLWKFEPTIAGSRVYRITNKAKGLVVDFAYGSKISNELVIVYPWNGNDCQQWAAEQIPLLTDEYEIVAFHSSLALDVPGGARAAGAAPCQNVRARTIGQRWRLMHRGAACYQIQSMHSNLMLQACNQPRLRVILTQDDPEAGDAQLWKIEPSDLGQRTYRIRNKALGAVLEIHGSHMNPGAQLGLGAWSSAPSQQWLLYNDADLT